MRKQAKLAPELHQNWVRAKIARRFTPKPALTEGLRLYQVVTLGAKRFETATHGGLVKGQPRHPTVEDDVVIYAGATILGRITIGRGSTIGVSVWLTHSVPQGSNIAQARERGDSFVDGGGI